MENINDNVDVVDDTTPWKGCVNSAIEFDDDDDDDFGFVISYDGQVLEAPNSDVVTEENRAEQSEDVQTALADMLCVDDESSPIFDEETDREIEEAIANADAPHGSLLNRAVCSDKLVASTGQKGYPIRIVPASRELTPADKARDIWATLVNEKAQYRFAGAIEVCASKVGTISDAVAFIMKAFPRLKRMGFDEDVFSEMIEIIPSVGEAWCFGEYGDEIGDRHMLLLARETANDMYRNGKLRISDIGTYARIRDIFENIQIRKRLAALEEEKHHGIACREESQPQITFNLDRRNSYGESDNQP